MPRKQIPFHKSMTADKRNPDFAYLRHNLFDSKTYGMYPSKDFLETGPDAATITTSGDIMDIVGTEQDGYDRKVFVENGTDLDIYNFGSSVVRATIANVGYEAGCFGDDGIHIVCDDDNIYRVNHQNDNVVNIGALPAGVPWTDVAVFDGLHYWYVSNNEIIKQLGDAAPTVAFNNVGMEPLFVAPYNDELVIFCQEGNSIYIFFWDKSDTDLFSKRIKVNNAQLIAGGVVDGRLMLVKGIGNSSNNKERDGEIVVSRYDGEKFEKLNSVKAGWYGTTYEDITGVDVGDEVILVALKDNDNTHNTTLYNNWILKIKNDGSVETQHLPDATYGEVHIVRVAYNFIILATRGEGTEAPRIFENQSSDDDYGDFENFNDTIYISNFLNRPANRHTLEGLLVVFEKLFEQTTDTTGEKLTISYRVSERDDFTTLGEVTAEKVYEDVDARTDQTEKDTEYNSDLIGLSNQIYHITEMPDDSPLPEFNEIQFKFESEKGFTVIDAWYDYDYIERNTKE